jgi:hypothetical protein
MLVNVTGGMSRWVGALNPDVEVAVCGCRPVRTMGGNRSVEIAFWPDSAIVPGPVVSNIPPMLRTELAVDPRLAPPRIGLWDAALRGNGYSVAGELAPGDVKESLDPGRAGVDILSMSRLGVVSALG